MARRKSTMRPLLALTVVAIGLTGAARAADEGWVTIYGSPTDLVHWKCNGGQPVPEKNAQPDGLNPHGSGGYVVIYEKPMHDFVLDFDYKITKGCNSGVFVRVGEPKDPVMTGLEIAIDDTYNTGMHDPGAVYDLVRPRTQVQKPACEWNHMTITARGPVLTVTLNGEEVSRLNHDEWPNPGKRPDGSDHKFGGVAIKNLNQKGYFGFQDHGSDCWYKNVRVKDLD
jgi:hypothetical protein